MEAQLARRVRACRGPRAEGCVLALHADGADPEGMLELCDALAEDFHVCAPQAPRSLNPFRSGGRPGSARSDWGAYRGFAWLRRDPEGRVDAASAGDALLQLEALARELRAEYAGICALVGRREGAALAAALARLAPELADLAVSVGAPVSLPALPGLAASSPVALLEVSDVAPGTAGRLVAERVREWLAARAPGLSRGGAPAPGPPASPR